MSIHDGHRKRLKYRFKEEGLDNFNEINVLELLLFYCIPRIDTNALAHRLLGYFGSLANVLDATVDELSKIEGMGENSAIFLSLISAVSRYYQVQRLEGGGPVKTVEDFVSMFMPKFSGRRNEMVYLLCLDAKCKKICCRLVGEGSINSAGVSVRKIVEIALAVNASFVVLAHNHPSGLALPSGADVQTTLRVGKALRTVDVTLVDHLVISDDEAVSLVESGLYHPGNL